MPLPCAELRLNNELHLTKGAKVRALRARPMSLRR